MSSISLNSVELFPRERMRDMLYERCCRVRLSGTDLSLDLDRGELLDLLGDQLAKIRFVESVDDDE